MRPLAERLTTLKEHLAALTGSILTAGNEQALDFISILDEGFGDLAKLKAVMHWLNETRTANPEALADLILKQAIMQRPLINFGSALEHVLVDDRSAETQASRTALFKFLLDSIPQAKLIGALKAPCADSALSLIDKYSAETNYSLQIEQCFQWIQVRLFAEMNEAACPAEFKTGAQRILDKIAPSASPDRLPILRDTAAILGFKTEDSEEVGVASWVSKSIMHSAALHDQGHRFMSKPIAFEDFLQAIRGDRLADAGEEIRRELQRSCQILPVLCLAPVQGVVQMDFDGDSRHFNTAFTISYSQKEAETLSLMISFKTTWPDSSPLCDATKAALESRGLWLEIPDADELARDGVLIFELNIERAKGLFEYLKSVELLPPPVEKLCMRALAAMELRVRRAALNTSAAAAACGAGGSSASVAALIAGAAAGSALVSAGADLSSGAIAREPNLNTSEAGPHTRVPVNTNTEETSAAAATSTHVATPRS